MPCIKRDGFKQCQTYHDLDVIVKRIMPEPWYLVSAEQLRDNLIQSMAVPTVMDHFEYEVYSVSPALGLEIGTASIAQTASTTV